VVAWAYTISGALAALSAILIAFYTNSISPASHGNFYELYAIAAAVVGGCSLRGGEGSVLGIVMGTALLQVLRNLVNLLDIPSSLDFAVMGAVILIGAMADQLFRAGMRRSKSRSLNFFLRASASPWSVFSVAPTRATRAVRRARPVPTAASDNRWWRSQLTRFGI
jgi:ribose transport system permease protein